MTFTLAPAELSIACTGQQHRLRWADGTLTALDHADPDGERTLAALGGQPATCIQILDTWSRYDCDLAVLVSASRGPHDPLVPQPSHGGGRYASMNQSGMRPRARPAAAGWTSAPFPGVRRTHADDFGADLPALLNLGGGLPERLVATVIQTWAARLERGEDVSEATPSLQTALYGRAVPVVREWLGDSARVISLELAAPDTAPGIVSDDTTIRLAFAFSWLRDVWAPGLSTILDELCIAARRAHDGTWNLTTLGRDLVTRHTLVLRRSSPATIALPGDSD
jgi:hypothetical protein